MGEVQSSSSDTYDTKDILETDVKPDIKRDTKPGAEPNTTIVTKSDAKPNTTSTQQHINATSDSTVHKCTQLERQRLFEKCPKQQKKQYIQFAKYFLSSKFINNAEPTLALHSEILDDMSSKRDRNTIGRKLSDLKTNITKKHKLSWKPYACDTFPFAYSTVNEWIRKGEKNADTKLLQTLTKQLNADLDAKKRARKQYEH